MGDVNVGGQQQTLGRHERPKPRRGGGGGGRQTTKRSSKGKRRKKTGKDRIRVLKAEPAATGFQGGGVTKGKRNWKMRAGAELKDPQKGENGKPASHKHCKRGIYGE